MKQFLLGALILLSQVLVNAQTSREPATSITLQFAHVVGTAPLHIDSTYLNPFGEQYTITKFRYYISNIVFTGPITVRFDTCFLIDERKPETKQITLPIPEGNYNQVSFLLGVDSIKNISGAQSGALDPLLDMFWTWNSGYVMAKLEGYSPVSKLPRHMIEYHIGGFSGRYNVLRNISLPTAIAVTGKAPKRLIIEANVNTWFNGVHELNIATTPTCTTIGALSQKYADNYSKLFTVRSTNNE